MRERAGHATRGTRKSAFAPSFLRWWGTGGKERHDTLSSFAKGAPIYKCMYTCYLPQRGHDHDAFARPTLSYYYLSRAHARPALGLSPREGEGGTLISRERERGSLLFSADEYVISRDGEFVLFSAALRYV